MVSAYYFYRQMGANPQQRSEQVTKKKLEESGTVRWRTGLGDGMAISHFGYKGGYVLFEAEGRYTAVPMGFDEADLVRSDDEALFSLVVRMQGRIDSNVEPFHKRKKKTGFVDEGGAYSDPVDQLSCEVEDHADYVVDMVVAEQVMRRAFQLMTRKQRRIWVKHLLEGYEFVELAKDLGITRQAVRDCFMKAQRIVDCIAEEYGIR